MMTWSKKHKKIIKHDKDSVENENNRKKNCNNDASSTVDLRNRFIAAMIQKTW